MNNTQKTLEIYNRIPWLFSTDTPQIAPDDYILQLCKKTNTSFLRYIIPNVFKLECLEQDHIKDSFIYTYPAQAEGGLAFTSFFGPAPGVLLVATVGKTQTDVWITSIQVHTNNPKNYFDFIINNMSFIHEETRSVGFVK